IVVADEDDRILITMDGLEVMPHRVTAKASPIVHFAPRWTAMSRPARAENGTVLVLDLKGSLNPAAIDSLAGAYGVQNLTVGAPGDRFERVGSGRYVLRADAVEDHRALLSDLAADRLPRRILVFPRDPSNTPSTEPGSLQDITAGSVAGGAFHSALALCQALCHIPLPEPVAVRFVHPSGIAES